MGDFGANFSAIFGFPPYAWQDRLYRDHFSIGSLPGAVEIPTGLGKTAVMALWLLARLHGAHVLCCSLEVAAAFQAWSNSACPSKLSQAGSPAFPSAARHFVYGTC